jgi:hypothetical protein
MKQDVSIHEGTAFNRLAGAQSTKHDPIHGHRREFPIEDPCSPDSSGQGIFDRKEVCHFQIRSLTPQQAAGLALAFAVQILDGN